MVKISLHDAKIFYCSVTSVLLLAVGLMQSGPSLRRRPHSPFHAPVARSGQSSRNPAVAPGRRAGAHRFRAAGRSLFVAGLLVLAACSSAPEPPSGFAGLAFGDPPPPAAVPERVPLPSAVAGDLRFYTLPTGDAAFHGVRLPAPVLAFFRGRFFSVSATLGSSGDVLALRERLSAAYGAPYCRDAAKLAICLWRVGAVDAILEVPEALPARFMLRHRPTADQVAAATGRAKDTPGGEDSPGK